jgi:hypothetical protein
MINLTKVTRYILILLCTAFYGCTTDFEVNEDYKEIQVVYGLVSYQDSVYLSPEKILKYIKSDSVLYFKVTKAYLSKGGSALTAAQQFDSLYYGDELKVTLEEKTSSGAILKRYDLIRTVLNNKPAGLFAAPSQVMYKTPPGFLVNPANNYHLTAINIKTGVTCYTHTDVIGTTQFPQALFKLTDQFGFRDNSSIVIQINAAPKSKFYDFQIRLHYTEWKNNDTLNQQKLTADWEIAKYIQTTNANGGEVISFPFQSGDFYKFIEGAIQKDPKKETKRRIQGVEFIFDGGGEEIFNYINVNRPSIGVVQKEGEYSNINNGYGIFSTRSRTKIFKYLDATTINNLMTKFPTSELGIVK